MMADWFELVGTDATGVAVVCIGLFCGDEAGSKGDGRSVVGILAGSPGCIGFLPDPGGDRERNE